MGTTKKTVERPKQTVNGEAALENTLLSPSNFRSIKPLMYIRYLSMIICIFIAVLFIARHFQILKFPEKIHFSVPQQLSSITPNAADKTALASEKSNQSLEPRIQYAKAINWLNEGKEDLAKKELKSILDKYPDFKPAKESYAALMEQ